MGHASLIELSAQGVENVDLTVDAQHTFWKSVYSKHTGFAMEPKELTFSSGSANYGQKGTVKIDRQGDMVADMWLVIDVDPLTQPGGGGGNYRFTNDFGRALINQVAVNIGGVVYDTKQGEYMHIWEELSIIDELQLNALTGKTEVVAELEAWALQTRRYYVPITFWFTENYSNALPLVGLYQHEVQIEFTFRSFVEMVVAYNGAAAPTSAAVNGGGISSMVLMVEYVFLENNERNYFARGTHKYMIEQVQFVGTTSIIAGATGANIDLHFNHPTNELIWAFRDTANGGVNKDYFNFDGEQVAPYALDSFSGLRLLLNSSERWTVRDPLYFRGVVPKRVHSRIPRKKIYSYAFSLRPENSGTDPSGNINFSRIDNSQFRFTFQAALVNSYDFFLWARSVNWSKIERGLSKLFFA